MNSDTEMTGQSPAIQEGLESSADAQDKGSEGSSDCCQPLASHRGSISSVRHWTAMSLLIPSFSGFSGRG